MSDPGEPDGSSTALRVASLLLALSLLSACGGPRILGFGGSRDGTLLVRHTESRSLEITADDERLGVAEVGRVTCFDELRTGTRRIRATIVGDTTLVRATSIVLAPERAVLWDVDHDQVLEGRAYASLCEEGG